jgi:ABC-type nitrate/sulfonate/bicarbonate transport system ATPase subunit
MTKLTMQQELARIWREEEVTMILVTHDLEEAIYLADRVLVPARERGAPQADRRDPPAPARPQRSRLRRDAAPSDASVRLQVRRRVR